MRESSSTNKHQIESQTKQTILMYYKAVNEGGWESLISDNMDFWVFNKHVPSRTDYLIAQRRFFQVAKSVEVKQLIISGSNVCAIVRYNLHSPMGKVKSTDVAEDYGKEYPLNFHMNHDTSVISEAITQGVKRDFFGLGELNDDGVTVSRCYFKKDPTVEF